MLAAGTASSAEHSITLCPSSVRKSTRIVGGTDGKRIERRVHINISQSDDREGQSRVSPTLLYRFNSDIEPQHCCKVLIREGAFVKTSVLKIHRALESQALVHQLHTLRQGAIISGGQICKICRNSEMFSFVLI